MSEALTFDDLLSAVASSAVPWDQQLRAAILDAPYGWTFTTFEAQDRVGLLDPPDHQHKCGAVARKVANELVKEGRLEKVGWTESKRPGSNGSGVRTYRRVRSVQQGAA